MHDHRSLHCTAGALGALRAFQQVQDKALVGDKGQSSLKTMEILHFMMPKIVQKITLAFHFLLCS